MSESPTPNTDKLVGMAHLLRPDAAAWFGQRIATYGQTPVGSIANNPAGLRCPLPGPHAHHMDHCLIFEGVAYERFQSPHVGVQVGMVVAQRATPNRDLPNITEPIVGWVPGFGPSDEAIKTYILLRADLVAFENEGVGKNIAPEMKTRLNEMKEFLDKWDKCEESVFSCDIKATDIGGELLARVIDSNTIRDALRRAGRKGYDKKDDRHAPDVTTASNFGKDVAVPVSDAAKKAGGPLQWFTTGDFGELWAALQKAGLATAIVGATAVLVAAYLGTKYVLPVYAGTNR